MDITIKITDTQFKSAEVEMADVQEWIQNAFDVRAEISKKIILEKLIAHCNENEIALAVGEAAQVQQAYDLKVVERAADATSSAV
tara:strand:+ start:812 stop:1066 length:255 start_codon:yes stop_codon:yes gene_type:complete